MAARTPIPLAPVSTASINLDAWMRDNGRTSEIDRIGGAEDVELLDVRNAAPGTSDYGAVVRPIPATEVAGVGIGAAADASASGNGSVIAILKYIRGLLGAGLPAALSGGKLAVNASGDTLTVAGSVGVASLPLVGQTTMANAISVAIASNQSAVPVSGTVAVSSLPALAAGSATVGAVNLAQYTPVSGRVPVDGSGVTQPVSGTVTLKADQVAAAPSSLAVSGTDALVVAANGTRTGLYLKNVSTAGQRVSLAFDGQVSVLDRGYTLEVGDAFQMNQNDFTLGAVNAIASAGSAALAGQEWS